jgi:adenylate cyclase
MNDCSRTDDPRPSGRGGKARIAWVPLWISLAVLAGAVALHVVEPAFMTTLGNVAFDTFQKSHPRVYQPAPVRIVDIDDESLEKLGQWPWPRTRMAELVTRLHDQGAAAIAFDVLFAEPDRTSPSRIALLWPRAPGLAEALKPLPDHDTVFAGAVGKARVVTGFALTRKASEQRPPARPSRMVAAGDDPKPFLHRFAAAIPSLAEIESAALGNGALTFVAGADGIIRRVPLLLLAGDAIVPTLAAEALRVAQGAPNFIVKSSGASGEDRFGGHTGIVNVRIGALPVATDPRGEVWVHFSPPVAERYIPAWKVLAGEAPPHLIDGNIVFVGTSAKGLMDLRFNPLGGIIPGVEIHAQAVEQMIQGTSPTRPDWAKAAEVLFMVTMWAILIVLTGFLGALWSAAVAGTLVAGSVAASWYAFSEAAFLFNPLSPALAILGIYIACSVSRHIESERRQRWIRKAFASYVSPNLVQHLVENPNMLNLGGELRDCSFVFTDLAGFTSLMEKLEPAGAVSLLNEYLDAMIAIAFRHDGTLDRIVGDAVAIMFSAPVAQPDHARRAVACALEMKDFADGYAAAKQAEGIPFGITRIGVHTGTVLIGNFGGKTIFDYRALGDPVNTAARLESVNKHLGTHVCVSAATAAACPGFTGRPVGTLVLKGKSEGIDAFEPTTDAEHAYDAAFRSMAEGAPGAAEAFASIVREHPDDALAAFHLARLERGETGIVIHMSEK